MSANEQNLNKSQHDAKLLVMRRWMLGGLSEAEWRELVALEYVLTWNYTDDIEKDENRYRVLSDRCWAGRANGA